MTGKLADTGINSRDVGTVLAALIAATPRPLTHVLQSLSGRELAIRVLAGGQRTLTPEEQHRLGAGAVTACSWRNGLLVTADGLVAAGVTLVWIPARLPWETCMALDRTEEPAGVILGRLGMRREDRRALATWGIEEVTGKDAATRSSAVLVVNNARVAIAEENITSEFAALLALP